MLVILHTAVAVATIIVVAAAASPIDGSTVPLYLTVTAKIKASFPFLLRRRRRRKPISTTIVDWGGSAENDRDLGSFRVGTGFEGTSECLSYCYIYIGL